MPRRSRSGSFAVPMSIPRYSCIASALTVSAPAPRASARSRERAVFPVPVASRLRPRVTFYVTRSAAC